MKIELCNIEALAVLSAIESRKYELEQQYKLINSIEDYLDKEDRLKDITGYIEEYQLLENKFKDILGIK